MNILMAAAENDALPGGKVGGIGDVVRDVPPALADAGHQVSVVTPGYGAFSQLAGARPSGDLEVIFAGQPHSVGVYQVPGKRPHARVTLWVLEHPIFAAYGIGKIYCDDPPDRPYASDAEKFALFCTAVAQALLNKQFGEIDVIHLHDWHTALLAVLRAFDPRYKALQSLHTVYTIHNLALQGVRPFAGDTSSLQTWYPDLSFNAAQLGDPRYPGCFNPMRAGINLCDRVQAVSPTYAREILRPSNPAQGFFGGEGLETDLRQAADEGRLCGILNGCEYPELVTERLSTSDLLAACAPELLQWVANTPTVESTHLVANQRLSHLCAARDSGQHKMLLTSVGRVTNQKVLILQQSMPEGGTALDRLLEVLGKSGLFVMLGSGDTLLEQFLTRAAARHPNFVFLKGYSETLAQALYASGDLFLMPSSFEPCGISQMLAMRAGQPCLVHRVGGLSDTVADGKNGFSFSGENLEQQAQHMIARFQSALELKLHHPREWKKISAAAAEARFLWQDVAVQYERKLYSSDSALTVAEPGH